MVTKILNNHSLVFYDSVEDLPVTQFHRYSKYVLVESGVGDSIQDIDRHISKIINFLNDPQKAHQELLNLRQCLILVASEQDVRYKATLCLVKSVDGKDWTDFSDSGLNKLYDLVCAETKKELDELSMRVRDAIDENLSLYFPKVFEDSSQKNYADLLRKRTLMQINSIVRGVDESEGIKRVTEEIYAMQKPRGFVGADSEEIRFDKQFEEMCLVMAKEFGGGIKKFTTMEFYTAFEHLNKQWDEAKKLRNKRKK